MGERWGTVTYHLFGAVCAGIRLAMDAPAQYLVTPLKGFITCSEKGSTVTQCILYFYVHGAHV